MKHTILALLAGAVLLAGCSKFDTVQTGDGEKVQYQVINAGKTEDRLAIVAINAAKAGDLRRAVVEVQNDGDFNYSFQYRYKWYDAAGMEVNPDSTGWTPVMISAKETKTLGSTAPTPAATTFKLFLQD